MSTNLEPMLAGVLGHVAERLQEAGVLPGRVHLAPGVRETWDNCCEDEGQLYLRVAEIYPSAKFPVRGGPASCNPPMFTVRLAVGTVRCAHTLTDDGVPPTPEQLTGDALEELNDMALILEALRSFEVRGISQRLIGAWRPKGPQGGCHGGEWEAYVAVNGLCWRADPTPEG